MPLRARRRGRVRRTGPEASFLRLWGWFSIEMRQVGQHNLETVLFLAAPLRASARGQANERASEPSGPTFWYPLPGRGGGKALELNAIEALAGQLALRSGTGKSSTSSAVLAQGVEAVVVTHLYGLLCDMDEIGTLTSRYGTPVIEDCAQAHGAIRGGKKAGSFGKAAAFSFYLPKTLARSVMPGWSSQANRPSLQRYGCFANMAENPKYHVTLSGARNSRVDELQAAILSAKLPHLSGWNARRREIAARYSKGLRHKRIRPPPVRGSDT